jgi:hypothetical protein
MESGSEQGVDLRRRRFSSESMVANTPYADWFAALQAGG